MANCCAVATVIVSSEPNATYALVNDPQHVVFLQQRCRIYGSSEVSIATASTAPARLRLALEEMAVGVTKGFLRLEAAVICAGSTTICDEEEQALVEQMTQEIAGNVTSRGPWRLSLRRHDRLRVYRDLWERGYVVTFGSKFGADFLIYKDNPKHAHAEALIMVKDYEEEFARVDIVSFCRMAKMVKKQFLFASVQAIEESKSDDEQKDGSGVAMKSIVYISLAYALLVSRQEERNLA
ncbi:unnamed protein product [Peronospora destructor]|uniref:tRNA-intron lyase n=1 Tax=Peronospora destructor TaxID=86335 RepID=A0AAV0UZF3_9STRA|nr:unnamed protein product [Peronospora destructor]